MLDCILSPLNCDSCHKVCELWLYHRILHSSRICECFHFSLTSLLSSSSLRPLPACLLFTPSCSFDRWRALGRALITNAVNPKAPLPPSPSPLPRQPWHHDHGRIVCKGGRLCPRWDHWCHCWHIQGRVTLTDRWRGSSILWGVRCFQSCWGGGVGGGFLVGGTLHSWGNIYPGWLSQAHTLHIKGQQQIQLCKQSGHDKIYHLYIYHLDPRLIVSASVQWACWCAWTHKEQAVPPNISAASIMHEDRYAVAFPCEVSPLWDRIRYCCWPVRHLKRSVSSDLSEHPANHLPGATREAYSITGPGGRPWRGPQEHLQVWGVHPGTRRPFCQFSHELVHARKKQWSSQ